ncbi:hypothetical protein PV325_007884 [Microctonus aethiopoides]|nr:hypothetical protein PV325_007884 [Microctonus aethiopoides]
MCRLMLSYKFCVLTELNSTLSSTSDMHMLLNNNVNNESESESDEDTDDNLVIMRDVPLASHINKISQNSTVNVTKIIDDSNELPNPFIGFPIFSKNSNLKETVSITTEIISTTKPTCSLDCGSAGTCYIEQYHDDEAEPGSTQNNKRRLNTSRQRCQCPLGRVGEHCQKDEEMLAYLKRENLYEIFIFTLTAKGKKRMKKLEEDAQVKSPRFTGSSWLAFPALHAAYKHIQLNLEFRPEAWNGILLLTGERDDLQGDFMAIILHHGFIEFSGVGVVRSMETVKLNEWNSLSVYRHRWDAWIQLNDGKRVQGRSKGLFSRITFQEPLFIGGPGNTTGLERLPVTLGFRGCIRHLEANEHHYHFPLPPLGDAINGFDVEECTADRCSKVPCSHGGKCLTTGGDTAVCLCPLGYTGDLCETRVDLQVPSFNGSSYLRYPGMADTSLSWLELSITLKPVAPDGVILYNGHHNDATGDFIALYLSAGYIQFTFDLGTGPATLRSKSPVRLGEWLEVRVSRTGRMATLEVEEEPPQEILAPGAFTQLSLPLNLYLGGAPAPDIFTPKMKITASFVGCIQTIVINHREIGILAEALGGVNVGNCGHACEARPCGDAECRPLRERFTCRCHPGVPHPCPAPDYFSSSSVSPYSSTMSIVTKYKNSIPSFTGINSYLHYSDADTMKRIISYRVDINMRFRTSSSNGLLLWSGRQSDPQEQKDQNDDFLALGLNQGYLTLAYNLGSGEAVLGYNLTRLDDDLWHRVRAVRNEQWASLVVDSGASVSSSSPGQLRELNTDTGLFIDVYSHDNETD